jgi:hypothetical protein
MAELYPPPANPIRTPFVFRPGGVAAGNVYTSWAALYAKYLLVAGPKVIEFDDSLGACIIPVGFYDMSEAEWTCRYEGGPDAVTQVTVTLADGVNLDRLGLITNRLKVIGTNTAGAVMVGNSLEGMVLQRGAELQTSGASPFVFISGGTSFEIVLLDYASITFGGGPVVETAAAAGQLRVKLGVGAVWQGSTIDGPAGTSVVVSLGALSATFDETQPGFAGAITADVLEGDLLVGDTSVPTGFQKLPIGAAGQVLTVVAGAVAWAAAGGGGALTINNTLFVSKNGNNATAVRNDWTKPFLTIQAAITAALAGDTIYIFPGTYAEALVMTQINKVHIKGAGINEVVIAPAAGVPFTWVITVAGITQFEMSDLTLQSAGGGGATCLSIDGNAVADAGSSFPGFVLRKLKIDDNALTNALDIRRVADLRIYDCVVTQADSLFRNVGRLWAYNSEMARPFEHYDVAEAQPTGGRTGHYYIGCHMSSFRWEAHPIVHLDHDCIVRGSSTQGVLSVGGGGEVPELHSRARHETGVTFLTLPTGSIIDFDFAVFTVTARIRFATAGPTRIMTTFRNAVLLQDGVGTNRIEGGDFIDIDARDATYVTNAVWFATTGGGDRLGVRRTLYSVQGFGTVIGANVIPITPQWPPLGSSPVVVVQSRGLAGDQAGVTVRGNDSCTVDASRVDIIDVVFMDVSP